MINLKQLHLLKLMEKYIKQYNKENKDENNLKKLGLKIIKKSEKYVDFEDDETNEKYTYETLKDKDIHEIKNMIIEVLNAFNEGKKE